MELDRSKFVTPEVAAERAVRSGDWVDYGFGGGYPELMDRALAARKGRLTDVKIRGGLVIRPRIEVVECDPEQISFHYYSWHLGDYERKLQARGLVQFLPMILRSLPCLYRDRHIRCDTAFVPVSLPDDQGYCGLGISNYAWRTIFQSARTVVFEINERLPRLQGVDGSHRVHLSEADYIVEGEHEPLPLRTYRDPSPTDLRIAQLVAQEIPDGAVLSLGVGSVPFAVASMLADSDIKDLGCHTGTISDAFLRLFQKGKLTNSRKEVDRGAFRSKGGKGFICLNSTHQKKDGTLKSNIVPCIPAGSVVSAPRTMIQYVATEYGVVNLTGLSLLERAQAMASIAHPSFREELLRYAGEHLGTR